MWTDQPYNLLYQFRDKRRSDILVLLNSGANVFSFSSSSCKLCQKLSASPHVCDSQDI